MYNGHIKLMKNLSQARTNAGHKIINHFQERHLSEKGMS